MSPNAISTSAPRSIQAERALETLNGRELVQYGTQRAPWSFEEIRRKIPGGCYVCDRRIAFDILREGEKTVLGSNHIKAMMRRVLFTV